MNGNLIEQIINTQWKNRNTGLPVTVIGVEGSGRDRIKLRHVSGRETLKAEHYFFADYDRIIPDAAQQQAYQERAARANSIADELEAWGYKEVVADGGAVTFERDSHKYRIEEEQ